VTWLVEAGPFRATDGDGRVLFDGVTVRLAVGAVSVLEGPSGAGKTTLLRKVAGLDPDSAAIRVLDGAERTSDMPGWRARVTLLAQDAPVLPGTIEDNLRFPFEQSQGRDRVFDRTRALDLLGAVGLGALPLDRSANELSGGERHRVGLVRGLLWDPPVLLADEVLSGVDPAAAEACWELMTTFARRPGRAMLAVLHDATRADRADRHLRLDRSGLVAR
jgi:putative ABC transport system ATP-binding protein